MRKADPEDWLESHGAVPDGWPATWRYPMTVKQMHEQASKNRPAPRFLVHDLAHNFGVSVRISSVAHPEINPIEMVWKIVKVALWKSNVSFSWTRLEGLAELEFEKITAEVWARSEDHAIGMEDYYMEASRIRAEVEKRLEEQVVELEDAEGDGVSCGSDGESDVDGGDVSRAVGSDSDMSDADRESEGSSAMEKE